MDAASTAAMALMLTGTTWRPGCSSPSTLAARSSDARSPNFGMITPPLTT
ncbi:hypothetical protein ACFQ0T_42440 [Kitasatospora gansuensis]